MKLTAKPVILFCAALIAVVMLTFAVIELSQPAEAANLSVSDSEGYLLRLENNEIVVYKNGIPTNTGIIISDMRDSDRALLENGISAKTYEDILKLIEDFSS